MKIVYLVYFMLIQLFRIPANSKYFLFPLRLQINGVQLTELYSFILCKYQQSFQMRLRGFQWR